MSRSDSFRGDARVLKPSEARLGVSGGQYTFLGGVDCHMSRFSLLRPTRSKGRTPPSAAVVSSLSGSQPVMNSMNIVVGYTNTTVVASLMLEPPHRRWFQYQQQRDYRHGHIQVAYAHCPTATRDSIAVPRFLRFAHGEIAVFDYGAQEGINEPLPQILPPLPSSTIPYRPQVHARQRRPEPTDLVLALSHCGSYFDSRVSSDDIDGGPAIYAPNSSRALPASRALDGLALLRAQHDAPSTLHVSLLPLKTTLLTPAPLTVIHIVVEGVPAADRVMFMRYGAEHDEQQQWDRRWEWWWGSQPHRRGDSKKEHAHLWAGWWDVSAGGLGDGDDGVMVN
ncbi:hypothetical protein DL93DRAFT_2099861 [Clavulina sp. PMI_390]|nr:hypothetical protein DL93DRAFT_2099861 [Clavulina sp. PMI_390]